MSAEIKNNSAPFLSSAFSKSREFWVATNTKICIVPVGHFVPRKCNWMTAENVENNKGKLKRKYVVKEQTKMKGRMIAFNVENNNEWKYQMPVKRTSKELPYYIFTFRCIDESKILPYLRTYFSLQPVIPDDLYQRCIIHKMLLSRAEKEKYGNLAKDYLYYSSSQPHPHSRSLLHTNDQLKRLRQVTDTETSNKNNRDEDEPKILKKHKAEFTEMPFKGCSIALKNETCTNREGVQMKFEYRNDALQAEDQEMILFNFLNGN